MNFLTIIVYVSGNIMSLLSDICCWYLVMEIVLSSMCGIIICMMVYAYKADNLTF